MSRALLTIGLVNFCHAIGVWLVLPYTGIYAERFGASPLTAMAIVSVFPACSFFSSPLIGALADRHGHRSLLVISQLGSAVGYALAARATSLSWLFAGRIIDGLTAGNISVSMALAASLTPPDQRARVFGRLGAVSSTAIFVGPLLSAWLLRWGIATPMWAAGALMIVTIACVLLFLPRGGQEYPAGPPRARRRPIAEDLKEVMRLPGLIRLLGAHGLAAFASTLFGANMALFLERRVAYHGHPLDARGVSLAYAYVGIVMIGSQLFLVDRARRRFGERGMVGFAGVLLSAAHVAMVYARDPASLAVSSTFVGLGLPLWTAGLGALISRTAAVEQQGRAMGLSQAFSAASSVFAPLCGGWLLSRGWLTAVPLSAGAGLLLAGIMIARTPSARPSVAG